MAFEDVCPDRIDLIHKNYRKLCNLLIDIDEWGQVAVIHMLTRYARTQFIDPNKEVRLSVWTAVTMIIGLINLSTGKVLINQLCFSFYQRKPFILNLKILMMTTMMMMMNLERNQRSSHT